jgi:hypothetical protein
MHLRATPVQLARPTVVIHPPAQIQRDVMATLSALVLETVWFKYDHKVYKEYMKKPPKGGFFVGCRSFVIILLTFEPSS